MPIQSFRCFKTERLFCSTTDKLFLGQAVEMFEPILDTAMRKLAMLDSAVQLADLPPESCPLIAGDQKDFWILSLPERFDLRFTWRDGAAHDVEIVRHVCPIGRRAGGRPGVVFPNPGDILRLEFLRPRGLSIARAARNFGLSRYRMRNLALGQAPIRRTHAEVFGREFGTTTDFWLNLEKGYHRALRREALVSTLPDGS